eukprot:2205202-Pleurochrysis_carterae.AAC.1
MAAGTCSSNLLAAPSTPAPLAAVPLTFSNSGQTSASINKLAGGVLMLMLMLMLLMLLLLLLLLHLLLLVAMQPPTSLNCNRLRQRIDAQRNTVHNLEAEIINLDKKSVRALRERNYVRQEAAAQQEGAPAAAEEARVSYESSIKQVQAAADVKYKALLTKLQEERDASSDKVTCLAAQITKLQRMLNRANAAARAVNKENAAAVSELEAQVQRLNEGRI